MADLRLPNDDAMYAHFDSLAKALADGTLTCYAVEHKGDTYTCLGVSFGVDEDRFSAMPLALFLPAGEWGATDLVDDYAAKERPDAQS